MKWLKLVAAVAASCAAIARAQPHATDDVAPLLQRHVERILTAQADDQASCDAAFKSNPLSGYLTALPPTLGIRNCVASNINALMAPLSASGAKCTLNTLISLLGSGNTGLSAFTELLNVLVSGITTAGSSSGSAATTASLTKTLANWTADSTKNKAFCSSMNDEIGPCVDALVPVLVNILDTKGACCSQLIDLYELLKLIVPDGKTLDQTLVAIINGLHLSMCTTTDGANTYCGQSLLSFVSGIVEETGDTSLLSPLLMDAGLPLFALPDGTAACSALDATSFASRVSSTGGKYSYSALSCCAPKFASLLQSFDDIVKHLTGTSLPDTLNLIAGLQDADKKFASQYDTLSSCSFKTTCTNPAYTLTQSTAKPIVSTTTSKTSKVVDVKCTTTQLCDADKVCSDVCEEGTAKVAPWVARATSYQRNLSYALPFCYTQLPATHNSATTFARGWGNRDQLINKVLDANNSNSYMRTNNQYLTLTDQLNLGVRFLEVDVHYYASKIRDGHCSRINFSILDDISKAIKRTTEGLLSAGETTAVTVEWQSSLMGCLPSLGGIRADEARLHSDSVKEIVTWLKANPTELIFVYLDTGSELSAFKKTDEMLAIHTATYGDLLLTPADLKSMGASWKSTPLTDFVKQGKRIVLLLDGEADGTSYFAMRTACGSWRDIPGGKTDQGAGTIWGAKTNSGSIVRVYGSQLHYATMSEEALSGSVLNGTATEPAVVNASTLPVFVNAGVNILAADGLDGAVVEALVWSWAANEPSRGDTAAEVSAKDGRWYGVADKSSIKNIACVSSSSRVDWKIVAQGSSCPSGYAFGAPKLAIENAALVTALKATGADATAQVDVDVSSMPVISAADEAAFGSSSSGGSGNSGGASGSSKQTSGVVSHGVSVMTMALATVIAVVVAC